MQASNKSFNYIFCSILLVGSPWLLLFITVLLSGGTIGTSHPIWTDELGYWHEILSLAEKGLDFGYYTMNEKTPHFLSFGSHGFGTVSVYSLYALVFGWEQNSMVLANCFFTSCAFLVAICTVRPSIKQIILLSIFYLTYVPLVLYCSSSMSELLNYSLLIAYMSLLYLFLRSDNKSSFVFVALLILCTYASFIRIIYIILFLPVLLERRKVTRVNLDFWKVMVIWTVISVLLYVTSSKFISPYPFSFLSALFRSSSLSDMILMLLAHTLDNSIKLLSPIYESPLQVFLRYTSIIATAYFLWKSNVIQSKFREWKPLYLYLFLLMFSFISITVVAYDIFEWRDYRVFAPILFSTLFFASIYDKKILKISILANIISLLLLFVVDVTGFFDAKRYDKIEPNLDLQSIHYTDQPQSPFGNTLLLDSLGVNYVFNIPAGIGVSFLYGGEMLDDVRSKYIYTSRDYKLKNYTILRSSPQGVLYEKNSIE